MMGHVRVRGGRCGLTHRVLRKALPEFVKVHWSGLRDKHEVLPCTEYGIYPEREARLRCFVRG